LGKLEPVFTGQLMKSLTDDTPGKTIRCISFLSDSSEQTSPPHASYLTPVPRVYTYVDSDVISSFPSLSYSGRHDLGQGNVNILQHLQSDAIYKSTFTLLTYHFNRTSTCDRQTD